MEEDESIHQVLSEIARLSQRCQFLKAISLHQILFNQMNFLIEAQQLVFKPIIFLLFPYLLFVLSFSLVFCRLKLIHPHLQRQFPRDLRIIQVFILPIFYHLFFQLNLKFFNFLQSFFNRFFNLFKASFYFQDFQILLFSLVQDFMFGLIP